MNEDLFLFREIKILNLHIVKHLLKLFNLLLIFLFNIL
jgi:hypothetical protein